MAAQVTDADFERLLVFRTRLRRFLQWSEEQATAAGLTPMQHQLLLAIRGRPGPRKPTIGDIAETLLIRHHSAVGLIDRAEAAGFVQRRTDHNDHRVVRVTLTPLGSRRLRQLSARHLEELAQLRTQLHSIWDDLPDTQEHRRSNAASLRSGGL
jgi:DNA-binding MarR family transcriptional regulator